MDAKSIDSISLIEFWADEGNFESKITYCNEILYRVGILEFGHGEIMHLMRQVKRCSTVLREHLGTCTELMTNDPKNTYTIFMFFFPKIPPGLSQYEKHEINCTKQKYQILLSLVLQKRKEIP